MNPREIYGGYGPGSQTELQEKMKQLFSLVQAHPELRDRVPGGNLTVQQATDLLDEFQTYLKAQERPARQLVIQADEITNLVIALNTMSSEEFIASL